MIETLIFIIDNFFITAANYFLNHFISSAYEVKTSLCLQINIAK